MKLHKIQWVLLAAVALGLMLVPGCEDSPLTASSDSVITVDANPGTISIPTGQTSGQSLILASLTDKSGLPLQGVTIDFSSGGLIETASGGSSAVTDANGKAQAILTLLADDPKHDAVDVSARSGSISAKITVSRSNIPADRRPDAAILITPKSPAQTDQLIIFDGTASADADKDRITSYRWTITSDNPDVGAQNPIVIETDGTNLNSAFERSFENEQNLVVVLEISTDPRFDPASGQYDPDNGAYDGMAAQSYQIRCRNEAPVARIAGAGTITTVATGALTNVRLDGTPSSDAEDEPQELTYIWSCGNGGTATPASPGDFRVVICQYRIGGPYLATLQVTDRGTGAIGPNGDFVCKQFSNTAQVSVTITAPAQ